MRYVDVFGCEQATHRRRESCYAREGIDRLVEETAMDIAALSVESIRFLDDGRIIVEVGTGSGMTPPNPPAVDNMLVRVYMDCKPDDTIWAIQQEALRVARGLLKT